MQIEIFKMVLKGVCNDHNESNGFDCVFHFCARYTGSVGECILYTVN